MKIKNKRLRLMRIGIYVFDIISWGIYGLSAYILKVLYSIQIAVLGGIAVYIIGSIIRKYMAIKPYNNYVDYLNSMEKNNIKI